MLGCGVQMGIAFESLLANNFHIVFKRIYVPKTTSWSP